MSSEEEPVTSAPLNYIRPPFPRAYTSNTVVSPYTTWWGRIRKSDLLLLFGIMIMLLWPWTFFGVVWHRKGIQMTNGLAKFVTAHPQSTNFFFLTVLANIVSLIIGYLFSKAILRLSQEWMTDHHLNLFHLSLISGLRNHKVPWGFGDRQYLLVPNRGLRALLVVGCWATFILVPSGTTSLLGPVQFNKTAALIGNELDFASNATDCIDWLLEPGNQIPNSCDWTSVNGTNYTSCLDENQLADVLESGRGNVLSLISNNTLTVNFVQLGGLHFLGPIRGILPTGPQGVPAYNTLGYSPLSDPHAFAGMVSYNYTLKQQGLNSTVSCEYTQQSPIQSYPVLGDTENLVFQYNGTCDAAGQADVLTNVLQFETLNSNNSLAFWACKSPPSQQEPTYFIYLRGFGYYETEIGNITCTISPIQPAIFSVTYQSTQGIFSLSGPDTVSPTTFSGYIDRSMIALGTLVEEAQSGEANLVAESIITFGAKYFQLPEGGQYTEYLRLYEQMIQGIIEYLATYSQLLISTGTDRPDSCTRPVTGTLSYRVMGWFVTFAHIGYLMPMTIINIASLVIIVLAIRSTESGSYESDPTDPKTVAYAEHHLVKGSSAGWKDCLAYRERPKDSEIPEEASV